MSWAVVDIDGVIADVRHRLHHVQARPKDWDAFFAAAPDDAVLAPGLQRTRELAEACDLVYLTGRPERCRIDTRDWLARNDFPTGELIMRDDTDRRPARLFKVGQVRRLARRQGVHLVVDDDAAVVAALRDEGFTVEHAQWMPESAPQQSSLFEAQEREGRT
jgi:hypothetical protein